MLIDAGPMVALADKAEPDHARCRAVADAAWNPLVTTWPCFGEAMYLAARAGGYPMQDRLWQMWRNGTVVFHASSPAEVDRMDALMRKYRDTPMDLADASLVAAAEVLGDRDIFTLDGDFYVYRLIDGSAFTVLPA